MQRAFSRVSLGRHPSGEGAAGPAVGRLLVLLVLSLVVGWLVDTVVRYIPLALSNFCREKNLGTFLQTDTRS